MYLFLDRPVTSLDRGCRFLIWSMRSWMLVANSSQCPSRTLAPAFAQWKMLRGLHPFVRIMHSFSQNALEPFRVCKLQCNHVSEHEAIVLSLFVHLAQGRTHDVQETLEHLICADAVSQCLGSMAAVSALLEEASLTPAPPVTEHP